ncbi:hypothetical protein EG68_06101 [Paragonimus skrjabini miyazakii]|uniref:Uncharacterized protein n=1 Tax=Paragonimus skrjabini miyazakii TaxID=59628 RepID=A0A8S9YV62_9TREM|nr:hypothetical protein EG68_06101 [Paragonimus skrjabini miyazakii]
MTQSSHNGHLLSQQVMNGYDAVSTSNSHVNGTMSTFQDITAKPGRFICRGVYPDTVHLYAENGYLIWIDPAASLQVLFTYGDTKCDFLCYLEPEVAGVSLTSLEESASQDRRVIDRFHQKVKPFHSGYLASAAGSTGTRHSCLQTVLNPYSYAVDSVDGYCLIELRALNESQLKEVKEPITRPFKLNFQLVL